MFGELVVYKLFVEESFVCGGVVINDDIGYVLLLLIIGVMVIDIVVINVDGFGYFEVIMGGNVYCDLVGLVIWL